MDNEANNFKTNTNYICSQLNNNDFAPSVNLEKEPEAAKPRVSVPYNQTVPHIYPYLPPIYQCYPPTQLSYWPQNNYYNTFIENTALENEVIACAKRIREIFESQPKLKSELIQSNCLAKGNYIDGPYNGHPQCTHLCKHCVECLMSSFSHPISKNNTETENMCHRGSCCHESTYSYPRLYEKQSEKCSCLNKSALPSKRSSRKKSCKCKNRRSKNLPKGEPNIVANRNSSSSEDDASTTQGSSESKESLAENKVTKSRSSRSNRNNKKKLVANQGMSDCERSLSRTNKKKLVANQGMSDCERSLSRTNKKKLVVNHGVSDCEISLSLEKSSNAEARNPSKNTNKKISEEEEPCENSRICTAYFLPI